ncbi:hypothetical protein D5086_006156 [Populus alba]|uniref:Uncharacterized protein n=1 Tax=Populus alba TaxID=43335 RepID=A0ACC4CJM7_POPAL
MEFSVNTRKYKNGLLQLTNSKPIHKNRIVVISYVRVALFNATASRSPGLVKCMELIYGDIEEVSQNSEQILEEEGDDLEFDSNDLEIEGDDPGIEDNDLGIENNHLELEDKNLENEGHDLPEGNDLEDNCEQLFDIEYHVLENNRDDATVEDVRNGDFLGKDYPPPFVGMEFESYDDAYNYYNCYAKDLGFAIRVKSSWTKRNSKEKRGAVLCCNCEGFKTSKEVHSRRKETRTGCLAMLRLRLVESNRWRVDEVKLEHNHLFDPERAQNSKSHKKMDAGAKRKVEPTVDVEVRTIKLYRTAAVDPLGYGSTNSYEGEILQKKYQKEALDDFESRNSSPILRTGSFYELQLSRVYTNEIFRRFQDEVVMMSSCFGITQVHASGPLVTYVIKERQGEENSRDIKNFEVMYDKRGAEVRCLCSCFNFKGYLCRHALCILNYNGVEEIPPLYILARWRKDLKRFYVPDSGSNNVDIANPVQWFDHLYRQAMQVVEEGMISQDRYMVAWQAFKESLNKVRLVAEKHL